MKSLFKIKYHLISISLMRRRLSKAIGNHYTQVALKCIMERRITNGLSLAFRGRSLMASLIFMIKRVLWMNLAWRCIKVIQQNCTLMILCLSVANSKVSDFLFDKNDGIDQSQKVVERYQELTEHLDPGRIRSRIESISLDNPFRSLEPIAESDLKPSFA